MRGGKRQDAGRKPGSATRRTRAIADLAAEEGVLPLDVMLDAMRTHHAAGDLDRAAAVAKDAAPYLHPRLSAVDLGNKDGKPLVVEIVRFADMPREGA